MVKHITVSYPSIEKDRGLDLFPIFLDFDFVNRLPRGVTARIDLLNLGKIFDTINQVDNPKEIVYFLKDGLCFEKGFFLIDFRSFSENFERYIKLLSHFEQDCFYFEKNPFLECEIVAEKLNKMIFVTEFI
ncbi:hypothetical protein [Calditerrivibrio nitroreducens]|uniref:Uncharacterized protein n=1 Tax=Calditerrivibrio nitroreducens (strain DSM 19672 / NBRC 101217 / Yu37-1) TaxID=768670 RepID=E4TFI9_CALNY|nr:hypothetical protein [Calditerrivibrio nitroreducens]ADR19562.1 hypothetical protein Calni_1655 [Calditerrivibrio nitroreducens DSM 19672]